ncbi:MAG: hypothetical protein JNM33_08565 [Rubrivivax sp.]|nr:hypothetical protein [Rubrivivax sp.]
MQRPPTEPATVRFRPIPARRRLLIAALAVATAAFVTWAMTRKSGIVSHAARHPADIPACAQGQTQDCVGSMTTLIAPAAAPSSASR